MEHTERIRVLIVDDIAETRENLRKLLSFDPQIEVVGAAATGEEGVQLAQEVSPDVVLMDINLPGIDGITATEQIVRNVPTAQIVILSVQGESGYMRRAMAAGARDFLVKPPSGDELMTTIRRVYEIGQAQAARLPSPGGIAAGPDGRPLHKRGDLITIFAPKGGIGCTTVAINLAIALQARLGVTKKVALLDGDLQFGDVGVMLNLQPTRTIADLAERLDGLDADLLSSVMTPHPSGIKVLLAPPKPEMAEWMLTETEDTSSNQKMHLVIDQVLEEFDLVIADTWGWLDDITLALLDKATLILSIITPRIPSIKDARNFMDLATQLGYPPEKLAMVINYADLHTGIRIDQIEKALMPAIAHIPRDERAGIAAANRGLPLVTEESGTPIAQAFVHLTAAVLERLEELSGGEDEGTTTADESQRILGRILNA